MARSTTTVWSWPDHVLILCDALMRASAVFDSTIRNRTGLRRHGRPVNRAQAPAPRKPISAAPPSITPALKDGRAAFFSPLPAEQTTRFSGSSHHRWNIIDFEALRRWLFLSAVETYCNKPSTTEVCHATLPKNSPSDCWSDPGSSALPPPRALRSQSPTNEAPPDAIAQAQTPRKLRWSDRNRRTAHDLSDVFNPSNAVPSSEALTNQQDRGEMRGFDFYRDPLAR